jgi:hypothetical protein
MKEQVRTLNGLTYLSKDKFIPSCIRDDDDTFYCYYKIKSFPYLDDVSDISVSIQKKYQYHVFGDEVFLKEELTENMFVIANSIETPFNNKNFIF